MFTSNCAFVENITFNKKMNFGLFPFGILQCLFICSAVQASAVQQKVDPANPSIPEYVDWRLKGIITPVRNQTSTEAAGALAFLDALEAKYAMEHGDTLELASESQLFGCCPTVLHTVDRLYNCVIEMGGLCSKATYTPLRDGQCNRDTTCQRIFEVKHEIHITRTSEEALAEAVAQQPVMIVIDATDKSILNYKGGLLEDHNCSSTNLNHAMLAVGYGVAVGGYKYWSIKNSWGTEWGESGYLFLAKDLGNLCGIASYATFPN